MSSVRQELFTRLFCDDGFFRASKEELLTNLLSRTAQTVPYYMTALRETGVWDGSSVKLENFAVFPILERAHLRDHAQSLVASDTPARKVYWNTSGGSTGEPCRFLQDAVFLKRSRAVTLQQKNSCGYILGDTLAKVWGDERELVGSLSFRQRINRCLKNEHVFNAFHFSKNEKELLLAFLMRQPKTFLVGYVQALFEFAQYLKKQELLLERVPVAMVSAGVCYPAMRELLQEVLADRIVDRYGSREVGNIACEVPGQEQEGMLISHSCILEVDTGTEIVPEGKGDLLVTSLINEVMPLIRYRIGDRGTLVKRSDGQVVLKQVEGRSVDMFKTVDGTLVDGEFFTHLLYGIENVRKFQVIQRSLSSVEFIVEATSDGLGEEEEQIRERVCGVMGKDCSVRYTYVETLPPHPSGKHRYTISNVG